MVSTLLLRITFPCTNLQKLSIIYSIYFDPQLFKSNVTTSLNGLDFGKVIISLLTNFTNFWLTLHPCTTFLILDTSGLIHLAFLYAEINWSTTLWLSTSWSFFFLQIHHSIFLLCFKHHTIMISLCSHHLVIFLSPFFVSKTFFLVFNIEPQFFKVFLPTRKGYICFYNLHIGFYNIILSLSTFYYKLKFNKQFTLMLLIYTPKSKYLIACRWNHIFYISCNQTLPCICSTMAILPNLWEH